MSDPIYVTVDSTPPITVSLTADPSPLAIELTTTGDRGPKGDTGPANSLSIGTVTTGKAAASITGTAPNQTLNLTIPSGEGTTYTAGSGITISGSTISAAVTSVAGRAGAVTLTSSDVSGLGTLATVSPTGTASSSTWLRGDGAWASITQGIGGTAEYANTASFPGTGVSGRLYIAADKSKLYRWSSSDSVYAEVGSVQGSATGVTSPSPLVAALIAG